MHPDAQEIIDALEDNRDWWLKQIPDSPNLTDKAKENFMGDEVEDANAVGGGGGTTAESAGSDSQPMQQSGDEIRDLHNFAKLWLGDPILISNSIQGESSRGMHMTLTHFVQIIKETELRIGGQGGNVVRANHRPDPIPDDSSRGGRGERGRERSGWESEPNIQHRGC